MGNKKIPCAPDANDGGAWRGRRLAPDRMCMNRFKLGCVSVLFLSFAIFCMFPAIVKCADTKKPARESTEEEAPDRKLPLLKPGAWEPLFELGESIYPSVAISTATVKTGIWDDDDAQRLGDRWGVIGIVVRGIGDRCPVEVVISGGNVIQPSSFTGVLPDADTVYCVYPDLRYEYEKLLTVTQTVPEILSFAVKVGGGGWDKKTARVQVRPVNECVQYFMDSSGNAIDTSFLFAAYVNENHPFINQILKEAMQSGGVKDFEGYADDADNNENVTAQIKAIWSALQRRGIRYSSMPASADDDNPYLETQYVRLLGESVHYAQANCVDGSVMLASIFRKIGLDASLVTVPEHMFVAVSLDEKGEETLYIETTDLGRTSFEEAVEDGGNEYKEAEGKFDSDKEDDQEYGIINIQAARVMGIMPIKDASPARMAGKGRHPTVVSREDDADGDE